MIGGREETRSDRQDLYIFVTSTRPDPYVNVLAHVLLSRPIASVHYIAIREHEYAAEQMHERLGSIMEAVEDYLCKLRDDLAATDSSASALYGECITKLEAVRVTREVVPWAELDGKLKEFASTGSSIFDVTTLKKNLLIDVVSLLLSRGCTRVYSFEILRLPSHDESDLIHALTSAGFKYRSVAESRHVSAARRRMIANFMTFRTLSYITALVTLVVLVIQVFFGETWLQTMIVTLGTATSIAGFLYFFLRNAKQ